MKEKLVEEQIREYIKAQCGFSTKLHADGVQGRDTLDLIGGVFGKPFMVDVKKPGGSASRIQKYLVKRAQKQGYIAGIVDSVESFKGLFGV